MRIVSFFPKPLPKSIIEGLKETAQIVYWSDLNDNERKNLSDVEVVISNPPVKMDKALLSFFPNLKMVASLGVGFDKFDLEEMDQFGNDIELCRHIVTSIEKFYKDDKYPSAFIDKALILSTKELDQSAIEFLEEETLLEIESKPINTLDSIIELMQKELQ